MTETPRVVKTPPCLGGAFVKGLGPRRRLDAADMAGAGVARLYLLLVRFRLMLFHVRDRNRVRRCPSRATRISGRPRSAQPGHGEPDSAAVGEQVDAVALEREYPPGSRRYVTLGGMTLAVPGSTGFVALAQRAVIGRSGSCLSLFRRLDSNGRCCGTGSGN